MGREAKVRRTRRCREVSALTLLPCLYSAMMTAAELRAHAATHRKGA